MLLDFGCSFLSLLTEDLGIIEAQRLQPLWPLRGSRDRRRPLRGLTCTGSAIRNGAQNSNVSRHLNNGRTKFACIILKACPILVGGPCNSRSGTKGKVLTVVSWVSSADDWWANASRSSDLEGVGEASTYCRIEFICNLSSHWRGWYGWPSNDKIGEIVANSANVVADRANGVIAWTGGDCCCRSLHQVGGVFTRASTTGQCKNATDSKATGTWSSTGSTTARTLFSCVTSSVSGWAWAHIILEKILTSMRPRNLKVSAIATVLATAKIWPATCLSKPDEAWGRWRWPKNRRGARDAHAFFLLFFTYVATRGRFFSKIKSPYGYDYKSI